MIKKKDYYDILEVKKDADDNEIKKAYKKVRFLLLIMKKIKNQIKLAIKFHPDKNQSKHTEEAFKKVFLK